MCTGRWTCWSRIGLLRRLHRQSAGLTFSELHDCDFLSYRMHAQVPDIKIAENDSRSSHILWGLQAELSFSLQHLSLFNFMDHMRNGARAGDISIENDSSFFWSIEVRSRQCQQWCDSRTATSWGIESISCGYRYLHFVCQIQLSIIAIVWKLSLWLDVEVSLFVSR